MVNVMFYLCMFCVALSMELFILCVACLTVFLNCLGKQFAIFLGVFAVEYYGLVMCCWRCSIGYTVYGLPKNVRIVPVIPVCI